LRTINQRRIELCAHFGALAAPLFLPQEMGAGCGDFWGRGNAVGQMKLMSTQHANEWNANSF